MTKLFSLYDSKGKFYHALFDARTGDDAARGVQVAVNDLDHPTQLSQSPADFTLFELGDFNNLTGVITPHATAIRVCGCHELQYSVAQIDDIIKRQQRLEEARKLKEVKDNAPNT